MDEEEDGWFNQNENPTWKEVGKNKNKKNDCLTYGFHVLLITGVFLGFPPEAGRQEKIFSPCGQEFDLKLT